MSSKKSSDPMVYVTRIRDEMHRMVEHLRADIEKINDPQCKAMFETSAEVLIGLIKTFDDYEHEDESAWK